MTFCCGSQLVDGRADLLFAAKGHVGSAGGVVIGVIVLVKFGGVQHFAVLTADHDQTAGGCILCAVLRCKGRVKRRVLLLPVEVTALVGVVIQQLGDNGILAAGLTEIINGHILIQALHQLPGAVAQRVHFGGREVELGVFFRDGPHQQIDQHGLLPEWP